MFDVFVWLGNDTEVKRNVEKATVMNSVTFT